MGDSTNEDGLVVDNYCYGNVLGKIRAKRGRDDRLCYTVELFRLKDSNGSTELLRTFTPENLEDVIRAAQRGLGWFNNPVLGFDGMKEERMVPLRGLGHSLRK